MKKRREPRHLNTFLANVVKLAAQPRGSSDLIWRPSLYLST